MFIHDSSGGRLPSRRRAHGARVSRRNSQGYFFSVFSGFFGPSTGGSDLM
jgi:hypothetical protein